MIGAIDPKVENVTIVGAGISGLLMGYALKRKGYQVQILEASSRVGGMIQSTNTPYGLVESAAHSLLVSPPVKSFFDELKIDLTPVNQKSKARWIHVIDKAKRLPISMFELIKVFFRCFKKQKNLNELTLEQFGNQVFGTEVTEKLLHPFVTGIFACQPKDLLATFAFPDFKELDGKSVWCWVRSRSKNRTTPKQKSNMMVPTHGMESIIQKLYLELKENIIFNTKFSVEAHNPNHNLVLCVPPAEAEQIIFKDLQLASNSEITSLPSVQYSPIISVTVFISKSDLVMQPNGVGILRAKISTMNSLGILFNSRAFPTRSNHPDQIHSLTCMLGGTHDPNKLKLSDQDILKLCMQDLQNIFGLTRPLDSTLNTLTADHYRITRWDHAIPLYNMNLKQHNDVLDAALKNSQIACFSNWTGELSIRKMIEHIQGDFI